MSESGSKTVIYAAMAGNGVIAACKYAAFFLTGSAAMLAEAIHSTADTGNQVLMRFGLARASKTPDAEHPFGYGKEVYFWSFMVAVLLFGIGASLSIIEGVEHVLHPSPVSNPLVVYIVFGLAFVFESSAWLVAAREFKRTKGQRGVIEGVRRGKDPNKFLVLFEDSAALLGIVIAVVGVLATQLTGNGIYDGLASIAIGLVLAVASTGLAIETKGLLIGESANPHVIAAIRRILEHESAVARTNDIATLHFGPEYILATISVRFRGDLSGRDLQATIARIESHIKDQSPSVKRIFIEAEHDADPIVSHGEETS